MSKDDSSNDSPIQYDVTIEGGGLTLERQVSEAKVARILGILLEPPGHPSERDGGLGILGGEGDEEDDTDTSATLRDGQPEKSIAEYMSDLGVKNNFQRLAAIALYRRDVLGKGSTPRDQFPQWFEKAGRAAPKNLSRDIREAVKRGLIAESTTQEEHYYPTNDAKQKISSDNE